MSRNSCPNGRWGGTHRGWRGERFHTEHPLRVRMFRRIAVAAFLLLVLALSGVSTLTWHLAHRLGLPQTAASIGTALAIFVAALTALRLLRAMRRFGMPLGAVMDAASSVADGDYTVRVKESGPPPVRALARSFNTMTQKLQTADRQRRDLMADLAHELRTPLTVLQGRIEGMIDGVYSSNPAELDLLPEQTRILSRLIGDLRTQALSEAGALNLQKELTDVGELIGDVVRGFEPEAVQKSVALRVEGPPDTLVTMDPIPDQGGAEQSAVQCAATHSSGRSGHRFVIDRRASGYYSRA
jgi:signal transduction histidine kinase